MFQIKNFESITASMINNVTARTDELTDFNVGSKNRTIIESMAREIDQLYQQLLKGLYEAIPVALYKSLGFARLGAANATGYVTFFRAPEHTGDVVIPANARVQIPFTTSYYYVLEEATLLNGQPSIDVFVAATGGTPGVLGNALANTITKLADLVVGIGSVTNPKRFSNGRNEETEQERKIRFQKWLNTIFRATGRAIEGGALTAKRSVNGVVVEEVKDVIRYDLSENTNLYAPAGYIEVYIWNGVDGASAELIDEVQKVLNGFTDLDGAKVPGWKGAGTVALVRRVIPTYVDLYIRVKLRPGYQTTDITVGINGAVESYFERLSIGETLIWTQLIASLLSVAGIQDVTIDNSDQNVAVSWNRICAKGNQVITEI